jgi:hypothetical protein
MQQAEVDAIGVEYLQDNTSTVYAVDIAYHESGLNYGSSEETVNRIAKKMIRTAMVILHSFNTDDATIIFASPKINPNIYTPLLNVFESIDEISTKSNFRFQFILSANEDFYADILNPTVEISKNISDTSELFMRSIQLLGLSEKQSNNRKKDLNSSVATEFSNASIYRSKRDIKYTFFPSEEEFRSELFDKKRAYIKIIYENGDEEIKDWDAINFKNSSNLRGNINSKTWFRSGYTKNNQKVIEGLLSIRKDDLFNYNISNIKRTAEIGIKGSELRFHIQ